MSGRELTDDQLRLLEQLVLETLSRPDVERVANVSALDDLLSNIRRARRLIEQVRRAGLEAT